MTNLVIKNEQSRIPTLGASSVSISLSPNDAISKHLLKAEALMGIGITDKHSMAAFLARTFTENEIRINTDAIEILFLLSEKSLTLEEIKAAYPHVPDIRAFVQGFLTDALGDNKTSNEIARILFPENPKPEDLFLDVDGLKPLVNLSPAVEQFLFNSPLPSSELANRLNFLDTILNTRNYKLPVNINGLMAEYDAYNKHSIHTISTSPLSVPLGGLEHNLSETTDHKINSFSFRERAAILLHKSSKVSALEEAKALVFLGQLVELSKLEVKGTHRLLDKVLNKVGRQEEADGLYLETSMILQLAEELRNTYGNSAEIEASYTPRPGFEVDFRVVKPEKGGIKKTYFGECKNSIGYAVEKSIQREKLLEHAKEKNGQVVYIIQDLNKDLANSLNALRSKRPDPFSLKIIGLTKMASNSDITFWNDSGVDITDKVRECLGYLNKLNQG